MDNNQLPDDWLSAYYDGELSEEQTKEAEALLESSSDARRDLGELTQLSKLIVDLPQEKAPASLAKNVVSFIESSNSTASITPKNNSNKSSKPSWLSYAYLSGTIASAALVMIAIFYSGIDSPSNGLGVDGFNPNIAATEDKLLRDTIEETELESRPKVALSELKKESGLASMKDKDSAADVRLSTSFLSKTNSVADDNHSISNDSLNSRMYRNLNTTGKVSIAFWEDNSNETEDLYKTEEHKPLPKKSKVSWEEVLSELEIENEGVSTVVLTCRNAKNTNMVVQKLLLTNAIPQLPATYDDKTLIEKLDIKNRKPKESQKLYYLKTEKISNSDELELSLRQNSSKFKKNIKQKIAPVKENIRGSKEAKFDNFAYYAKKSQANRSEAILQGNGAGLYVEVEPVQFLNSLHLIENQKAIQKIVVNGKTNLKRNEFQNNGTNIELIYEQNSENLGGYIVNSSPSSNTLDSKTSSEKQNRMVGNTPSKSLNPFDRKKGLQESLKKLPTPNPGSSNTNFAAGGKSDSKMNAPAVSSFGTNTYRGLNRSSGFNYKTRHLSRYGFQTPVDLPIVDTKPSMQKARLNRHDEQKTQSNFSKPTITQLEDVAKDKIAKPEPFQRNQRARAKGKQFLDDEAESAKTPIPAVKRYRVLFVFKEENEQPSIKEASKNTENSQKSSSKKNTKASQK